VGYNESHSFDLGTKAVGHEFSGFLMHLSFNSWWNTLCLTCLKQIPDAGRKLTEKSRFSLRAICIQPPSGLWRSEKPKNQPHFGILKIEDCRSRIGLVLSSGGSSQPLSSP
jgi:hypothetical protein